MNTEPLYIRHSGTITLLLCMSLVRPAAFIPGLEFSLVPLALLTLFSALLYKIYYTIGFKAFWYRYKPEIILVCIYQFLCLISLISNHHRFPSPSELLYWGLTFILIQGALPVAIALFNLPQNTKGISLSHWRYSSVLLLCVVLLIPVSAIWQYWDSESIAAFQHFFISGNINDNKVSRGILAISTDLGAISAVLGVMFVSLSITSLMNKKNVSAVCFLLFSLLNFVAGVTSGSRVFILMSGTGLVALAFIFAGYRKRQIFLFFICILLISSLFVQIADTKLAVKLSQFFPFLLPLNIGAYFSFSELIPTISIDSFGERIPIWELAIEKFIENPLLGISNGGFRLESELLGRSRLNNTHNFLLQALVDAGILGFTCLLILLHRFLRNSKGFRRVLVITTIVGLLVDNFLDHSLVWILVCCLPLSFVPLYHSNNTMQFKVQTKWLIVSVLLVFITNLAFFSYKSFEINSQGIKTHLAAIKPLVKKSYRQGDFIVVSESFENMLAETASTIPFAYFHKVPATAIASYPYIDYMLVDSGDIELDCIKEVRPLTSYIARAYFGFSGCDDKLSFAPLVGQMDRWLSSNRNYFERYANVGKSISLDRDRVDLFSPAFLLSKNSAIVFKVDLHTNDTLSCQSKLIIQIMDAQTRKPLFIQEEKNFNRAVVLDPMLSGESHLVYMQISLDLSGSPNTSDSCGVSITHFSVLDHNVTQ